MIIDFLHYVQTKQDQQAAIQAALDAQTARREHLEMVLTDLLAELEAA